MAYLYMTIQHPASPRIVGESLQKIADSSEGSSGEVTFAEITPALKPVVFTRTGRDSLFRTMRRICRFLDDWKQTHPDTSVLLSVDLETAKIVNSYFHGMSDWAYEEFRMEHGEILRYQY